MRKVKHPCLPKWRARIAKAYKRGFFNEGDRNAADKWNTCAFGEARKAYNLPAEKGEFDKRQLIPTDKKLENLGLLFASAVHAGTPFDPMFYPAPANRGRDLVEGIECADNLLDKIEARLTRMMARA